MNSLNKYLNNDSVKNVAIFICDDLRFDYLPQSIKKLGVSARMVAPGTSTLESIPSYLSGQYPSEHEYNETDSLELNPISLLIKVNENVGLNSKTSWYPKPPEKRPLIAMNHESKMSEIGGLDEPFVYVEHDYGVHSPYGIRYDEDNDIEYWKNDPQTLVNHYEEAAHRSANRFFDTLEDIKKAGILDKTLLIFLSDHGELLGEAKYGGIFGHKEPICPELVYVPVVFIGADLPRDIQLDTLISGLDILPTLLSAQGHKVPNDLDGLDLCTQPVPRERIAFSETRCQTFLLDDVLNASLPDQYRAVSAWDNDGGYVCSLNSKIMRFTGSQHGRLISDPESPVNRRNFSLSNYKSLLQAYCKDTIKYGNPNFEIDSFNSIKSIKDLQNSCIANSKHYFKYLSH